MSITIIIIIIIIIVVVIIIIIIKVVFIIPEAVIIGFPLQVAVKRISLWYSVQLIVVCLVRYNIIWAGPSDVKRDFTHLANISRKARKCFLNLDRFYAHAL